MNKEKHFAYNGAERQVEWADHDLLLMTGNANPSYIGVVGGRQVRVAWLPAPAAGFRWRVAFPSEVGLCKLHRIVY